MNWKAEIDNSNVLQSASIRSFVGGKPFLPTGIEIPTCKFCGARQTFFFQIEFPDQHLWSDLTLAVFMCTACADEDNLIPEMLEGQLHNATVEKQFLETYQTNFRFIVYENDVGVLVNQYVEKIAYSPIKLVSSETPLLSDDIVGDTPIWLLDDESPGLLDNKIKPEFLMQIAEGRQYPLLDDAPPQIEIGLSGMPQESLDRFYQLFIGNTLYLFGYQNKNEYLVYAITQI